MLKLGAVAIHQKGKLRRLATPLIERVMLEEVKKRVLERIRNLYNLLTICLAGLVFVKDKLGRLAFAF